MLLIVWTGLGLLIVPLLIGAGIVAAMLLGELFGPIGTSVGLAVGTVLLVVVGRAVNRHHNEHTLYGIPVQHWAWIQGFFTAFSIVLILTS
ncbi:hypothetical protein [Actinomadura keratinilytica]|jgi:hypothetical protein|uniref:Uncharacterized protein n=1 Tax=Actinomadura keratinilytica TaxID=547461 RepID=A0ABP7Y5V7_9ACTN